MKECKVDGCSNPHLAKGYCSRHYRQTKRRGYIYPTFLDGNEIIDYKNGTIGVVLYNRRKEPIKTALVSQEDIDLVKKYRWCLGSGYMCTSIDNKTKFFHTFILPDALMIDHINGNKSDNRRHNLRSCNKVQNAQHRVQLGNRNKSGVTGVSWDKSKNKWRATIRVHDKNIHIGRSDNFDEAVKQRKKYEQLYFKEFAPEINYTNQII